MASSSSIDREVVVSEIYDGSAGFEDDLIAFKDMMREFQSLLGSLDVPIDKFQDFEAELAELPGRYTKERGGCMWVGKVWLKDDSDPVTTSAADSGSKEATPETKNTETKPEAKAPEAKAPEAEPKPGSLKTVETKDGYKLVPAAILALKFSRDGCCEAKRLFVRPIARGRGLGCRMIEYLLKKGQEMGYKRIVLDSLDRLPAAKALYAKYGFVDIPPYVYNPMHDAVYMGYKYPGVEGPVSIHPAVEGGPAAEKDTAAKE